MYSTHYMDLLMQNSPWNLIYFMAIPVVLAETVAITELLLPFADDEELFFTLLDELDVSAISTRCHLLSSQKYSVSCSLAYTVSPWLLSPQVPSS